jgi:subtilisin family serine protease
MMENADEDRKKQLEGALDYYSGQLNFYYNPEHNGRALIGDDPDDFSDVNYGNNDVEGPDALHGTHVGGIIGAVRGNKIGGDGVANNVLLMSLRAVPDGDEFDKDIALAIRYAVDNGAKVINASFGKAYAQLPEEVYNALRYAEENDVLFVHAAGNSGQNLDEYPNYPANMFPFQNVPFTNYLSIGASTRNHDGSLAAGFSNYSTTRVDIFAPGAEIYNTVPDNNYQELQGTSMAAPMVSGVAALLKGYFPKLSMVEIRQVILDAGDDFAETDQAQPGTGDMVKFKTLSATGKVVNVLAAVKLAEERSAGK